MRRPKSEFSRILDDLLEKDPNWHDFVKRNPDKVGKKGLDKPKYGYVYVKPIRNHAVAISSWCKSDAFMSSTVRPTDMHCTIMYDDRNKITKLDRSVNPKKIYRARLHNVDVFLGDGSYPPALIIELRSIDLQKRFQKLRAIGFRTKYLTYRPHITVKLNPTEADFEDSLIAFRDLVHDLPEIILTGETWEPVNKTWAPKRTTK